MSAKRSLLSIRNPQSAICNSISRRDCLRLATAGVIGGSMSGWIERIAAAASGSQQKRSCILLWMTGGPSQIDTFDPKPGHDNGGPVKAIETSVPGMRISEYLPKVARQAQHLALIRSMSTKEGDHTRATYLLRTGYLPQGPVQYPTFGSLVSKELAADAAELPGYVSIAPFRFLSPGAYEPGFLGPQFASFVVGNAGFPGNQPGPDEAQYLRVQNLDAARGVTDGQLDARLELLAGFEREFLAGHTAIPATSHQTAYQQAVRLMRSRARAAFELDQEDPRLRDAYGRNPFGQGCLLARRLVERSVPFVEVSLNGVAGMGGLGWDTHGDNFNAVSRLCEVLDPGWATLLEDLQRRGLLDTTLVVWMGEFGRTPRINQNKGRDHFPAAWSAVLAGGGLRGGQVIGRTSDDGMLVEDRPVAVPDLLATICTKLGIDPQRQNMSNVGRPIRIVNPDAKPIQELLA